MKDLVWVGEADGREESAEEQLTSITPDTGQRRREEKVKKFLLTFPGCRSTVRPGHLGWISPTFVGLSAREPKMLHRHVKSMFVFFKQTNLRKNIVGRTLLTSFWRLSVFQVILKWKPWSRGNWTSSSDLKDVSPLIWRLLQFWGWVGRLQIFIHQEVVMCSRLQETTPCIYRLPELQNTTSHSDPSSVALTQPPTMVPNTFWPFWTHWWETPTTTLTSTDFTNKIKNLRLDSDEKMVSFDVTPSSRAYPQQRQWNWFRRRLPQDQSLADRTNFTLEENHTWLDLCLTTTYFHYWESFYRQKLECTMGSSVSSILANLYKEKVEKKVLESFSGSPPCHWYRCID